MSRVSRNVVFEEKKTHLGKTDFLRTIYCDEAIECESHEDHGKVRRVTVGFVKAVPMTPDEQDEYEMEGGCIARVYFTFGKLGDLLKDEEGNTLELPGDSEEDALNELMEWITDTLEEA